NMCVFAHHNFLKVPPFGKMDCISCRNVLIYMEPYLQKKALTTFHYALNPKGLLLLGKSETTGGVPDLFGAEGVGDKLYTRKDVPGRFMQVASQRSEQILNRPPDSVKSEAIRTDFQKTADDILLTKYTPAGVVVNETMDIVHFRGNTSTYLEQAPGKPSHNLLMMAKNGLGFELRNILHKAKIEKVPVIKENIPLSVNGHLLNISIEAVPLPNTMEPYYLILFHDNNLNDTDSSVKTNRKKVSAKTKKEEKDIQIQLLEQELAQAREDMRSITEDQEASNEELQSANEELLSGSEELQSLNEELETSKEELQSTNEELSVLNHELISLNEQVTDARNYSESIVATLYQPLLVLDKHLRVKSANQAFYKIFKVDEQETEGVLIYDLGNRQWNIPELRTLLEEILPQKKHITDFEVTHNFLSIGERVILLSALELTREKKEEKLILLSIEDITERKEAAKKIEENEKHLQNIFLNAPTALCILEGTEQKVILANKAYEKLINRKAADLLGKSNREVFPELIGTGTFELFDKVFETGEPFSAPEYAAMVDLNNEGAPRQCYFNFSVDPLKNDSGKIYAVMAMAYDITPQVETRKKIEENEHRYHMMLMNSPFAFSIMKGKNMVVTLANDLMKDFWGKGQQVEGKPVFEVLPELIDQPFPALLDKVYSSGEPLNANEILARLNRNGIMEDRYFNIVFQPHFEADKTISGVICIAHEVTSQVLARKQIEDSNKRYNMLLMQSPFAFAVLKGKDMVVTLANDSVKEMWGKGKEVEGKPFIEVLPELKNQRFPVLLNEVYTTGIPYSSYESLVVLQRNGIMGDTYFNFTYQPYREADETISGVVIIATEVTPQAILNIKIKESEEKFSTLADNMENLAWIADGGGSVYWYNKRWFEYTGTTLEEMAGWGWQKVHHPDHVDDVVAFAKKAWYINEPFELTFPLRRHDGEYRWFLTSARPIADADGKVIRWLGTNTDITAQIEATKKIEESEAFNRSILENSPDCVKLVDRDGHIQFMNTNGLCLLEIDDFKSIKNKPWTELWGSDTKPVVLDAIDKALHGKTVQFQALGHTVKGTPKWWDVMVSPFVQPGTDLVSSIISVSRDITSQKEFQSLLEYRKALLEAHNEASVDGLLLVDSLGKIISYNQRFTEIWNMPKSLVAENNDEKTLAFAIAQLVHPEQFMEKMNHLYANPDVISIDELEYLDGKIVERNGYPIVAPDGSYYAWSWTFRDITEARKAEIAVGLSELNFRQLAELMPEKISHADAEGNFIYLNQNWLDYTGLSFEELENWGGEKTIHLNDLEEVTSRWQHSIKTGDNFEMEMRIRDTNGDYIWHLSRSVAVKDDMGNIKKWIGTTTQIQKLKEDEQRKSDFLKMVSHELKTPVTSIKGYVQFLSKMLNKEQEELLQPLPLRTSLTRIDSQLGRLTRLITELLDLSRIEESKIVLEKQPFKLNDLVLEAIEDIRFSSPRHEIIVLGKQKFSILGDRDRIGQVIINFITNAIKYSPHNDTIEVRINKVDNNRVSVSVKDEGIGIDKKDQEKIFDRFYRVEGKNEQRYGGFGIGLYIAAEIVKRHEGSIKVESGLGKGSIFTLTLPYISK
ncbi:MAG: PAS domain-containing protein, partial [Flavobacterium sp.]|nr:PAS domain-containing protein [Pedobacter sp.]